MVISSLPGVRRDSRALRRDRSVPRAARRVDGLSRTRAGAPFVPGRYPESGHPGGVRVSTAARAPPASPGSAPGSGRVARRSSSRRGSRRPPRRRAGGEVAPERPRRGPGRSPGGRPARASAIGVERQAQRTVRSFGSSEKQTPWSTPKRWMAGRRRWRPCARRPGGRRRTGGCGCPCDRCCSRPRRRGPSGGADRRPSWTSSQASIVSSSSIQSWTIPTPGRAIAQDGRRDDAPAGRLRDEERGDLAVRQGPVREVPERSLEGDRLVDDGGDRWCPAPADRRPFEEGVEEPARRVRTGPGHAGLAPGPALGGRSDRLAGRAR